MSRGQVCAFIDAEKTIYGVRRLCRVFAISPTTFYAWAAPWRRPHRGRARRGLRDP